MNLADFKSWLKRNKRNIFYSGFFIALVFLGLWMSIPKTKTYLDLGYPEYSLPQNTYAGDTVPDFKSWEVKKEGEIDADNDGKKDFKLRYYLKDREDAIALFVPLENGPPKLLIYAHYPNNYLDIFSAGFYIGFGVFESGKWTLVDFYKNYKYTWILKEELKNLKIKMDELDILVRIIKTNFNRRNPKANKNEGGELFTL